jgi:hypothetical protein
MPTSLYIPWPVYLETILSMTSSLSDNESNGGIPWTAERRQLRVE